MGVGAGVNDPAGTKNPYRPTFLEESVKKGVGITPTSTVGTGVTAGGSVAPGGVGIEVK